MTDRYAVIGNPIAHSKSPQIHAAFARQTRQDMTYEALLAPLDGFRDAVLAFRAAGGRGMNVTLPFKLQAVELATELSDRARAAGAVNTLGLVGDRILADNTDGVGLVNDLHHNLGVRLKGRRVLVLGAGGAARGALLPLLAQAPAGLMVANRGIGKALALATQFSAMGPITGGGYADLRGQAFDVVINTTSASLTGERLPIDAGVFGRDALAYDMVYGKGLTAFLRQARDAGVERLADGLGMLVEQAAESFAFWRGVRPETAPMIKALSVPLT
ncbi:MAG: shikimate dehydrogenase [Burkholderiales bacterium]|nr:shikimate dehydrogenase [Burkholderiales bacterium]